MIFYFNYYYSVLNNIYKFQDGAIKFPIKDPINIPKNKFKD